eukprot:TRINITY_DN80188_c0_g1_i1.p1 TRINITY_DN80188_c0_g1~~TRINITY_DN80188_c0_g1_i1.p1  ORF type:complete len:1479 (-),score=470.02 TRINITY_DN80188_c0_g1_i1:243-4679(-)
MPRLGGIDAALMRLDGKITDEPKKAKAEAKKAAIAAPTVDLKAEGFEGCKKRVADMEAQIDALQKQMQALPPTKGNKMQMTKFKEEIEQLQRDPNYRGALAIVREKEEEEREKRRAEREKEDELAMMGGGTKKKGGAQQEPAKPAAKAAASKASATGVDSEDFEADAEVVGIVKSGCEGAPMAHEQLRGGPGTISYQSEVKQEVATMALATFQQLSTSLKRAAGREGTLKTIRALLWNPPAVLPALPTVLGLLEEPNIKSEPGNSAKDLLGHMCLAGPNGKAVPEMVLPVLLAHVGAAAGGKWKVKVGCLGILREVLKRMASPEVCPLQLGLMMPQVTQTLRSAVGDARKDVKKAAEEFLVHIGQEMVGTPEIKGVVNELIASIIDSANMQKASEILNKLGNTTFMNTVDAASFALLFPIVSRAMKEKDHDALKKAVQIVGASVTLIQSPEFLMPYLPELIPLLQDCLMHPSADVEREAAKAFGMLGAGLPRLCDEEIMPYLLRQLQSNNTNEDVSEVDRRGAAHGLSEVLIKRPDLIDQTIYGVVLPRISSGETAEVKAGALAVFQFFPHLAPSAFLAHLKRSLPVILQALRVDNVVVSKQAKASLETIIAEFGQTCPNLMLPPMQDALFFEEEEAQDLAMQMFFLLCEKIQDAVKFGQDFTSVEVLSDKQRKYLLSSIYIARSDPANHAVRRHATLLWKEKVKSGPKARAEILPTLLGLVKGLKNSGSPLRVAAADACLEELKSGGDVQDSAVEEAEALVFYNPITDDKADATEPTPPPPPSRIEVLRSRCQELLPTLQLPAPLRKYIEAVVTSCCVESKTQDEAVAGAERELRPLVAAKFPNALEHYGLAALFPKFFDGVQDVIANDIPTERPDGDVLLRVQNLMLMYGAGHTLLKDTTLELKKGHTYGVVGRNGAGKTTLMSTLASGNVAQIPKWLKMLHVKPEVLIESSDLSAVQFCRKHNPEESGSTEEVLQKALSDVGFPTAMQEKCVSELSGGWRMKLLIASAMMRDCDLLLLDEPTNHLDTASVAWLESYIRSLTQSTVMVISHDPNFLNRVCTDIIQYSKERTLEYYEGNFEAFRKVRNITSDEEAEALLLGNEPDDGAFKPADRVGDANGKDDAGDDEDGLGLKASALDKSSKISFPIPGKLVGHSTGKPVLELRSVYFSYEDDENLSYILEDVSCKVGLSSRVGIVGRNGAGKTTMLNLLCGELQPSPGPGGSTPGEVYKHRNLRLSYISQDHMFHINEFMNSSPYVYTQKRFQNGWDEALQQRLTVASNDEVALRRKELAAKFGKYGRQVSKISGRQVRGNEVFYEVEWMDLDDPKQNTYESVAKLKKLDALGFARAYDERLAAQTAGIDQRPLTNKEIVKHFEQFGLDEELVLNRQIGTFSAGQRSKLTLGAACWTKPHVIALDEPTNYIDMETLDSLAKGLNRYKGAVLVISHSSEFVSRVCDETWLVDSKHVTVNKEKKDKK